MIHNHEP